MSFRKADNSKSCVPVPDSWVKAQSYSFRKRGLKVVSLSFTTSSKNDEIVSRSTWPYNKLSTEKCGRINPDLFIRCFFVALNRESTEKHVKQCAELVEELPSWCGVDRLFQQKKEGTERRGG